ncbi:MAG: ATP-binding protein [Leptospiraceae bacterium]|nr:ATP-binding protein [Leptospiraceae bacterium]
METPEIEYFDDSSSENLTQTTNELISFSVYTKNIVIEQEIINSLEPLNNRRNYQPEFFSEIESAVDFLTYGQTNSRLFIIEYDSERDDFIDKAIERIHNDPWLHGTVIVLIADKISHIKASKLIDFGVIDFISLNEIQYKVPTILKLVTDNLDLFELQQFSNDLTTHKKGRLVLKNNLSLVPKVAALLMSYCYAAGFRNLEHFSRISLSLHEMITNAIEHGNCEIGFEEKTAIINKNESMTDVIDKLCDNPRIGNRKVYIDYDISFEKAEFTVTDEGFGFNLSELPDLVGKENIFAVHGRGIMMTRNFVDILEYNDKGNSVKLLIQNNFDVPGRQNMLSQFSTEEIITFKPGEVLIEDGSESHNFYYILTGKLGIYINEKQVDILTPEDIFVGEMAFLNRNRRTGTVKAIFETKVMPISRRGFIDMIKTYPYAGVVLARLLTKRLIRRNRNI